MYNCIQLYMCAKTNYYEVDMSEEGLKKDLREDKYTLRGKVFEQLRKDIIRGKYQEYEELREIAIANEYGVSRTPVREAFRQLELEGLISIIPNKGAYVQGITEKDVRDIYLIRSYLEALCVREAMDHITLEKMDELEENIMLSNFYAKRKHENQLSQLDKGFHEILYEATDNKILKRVLRDLHEYVSEVGKQNLSNEERVIKSNEEHAKIFQAIKLNNRDLAEKLMTEHVENAYQNVIRSKK